MRRIRRTIGIQGMIGISVVGDDNGFITVGHSRVDYRTHTFVYGFNRFFDSLVYTGMPHHITVGEIANDKIVFSRSQCIIERIFHFINAHFGFQIVSRDFGRRYQYTVFPVEFLFTSP